MIIETILISIDASILNIGFAVDVAKIDLLTTRNLVFGQVMGMIFCVQFLCSYLLFIPLLIYIPEGNAPAFITCSLLTPAILAVVVILIYPYQ